MKAKMVRCNMYRKCTARKHGYCLHRIPHPPMLFEEDMLNCSMCEYFCDLTRRRHCKCLPVRQRTKRTSRPERGK